MVYHGLPINSMVIFHGYVSHNQMVAEELPKVLRGALGALLSAAWGWHQLCTQLDLKDHRPGVPLSINPGDLHDLPFLVI